MRKYQPIWEQLKKKNSARIAAVPALHARIKKAVIKEKDQDKIYKRLLYNQSKKARLEVTYTSYGIEFKLSFYEITRLKDL